MAVRIVTGNVSEIDQARARLSQTRHSTSAVVCAGDVISTDNLDGFLRGHGTQANSDELRATQCGLIQRVNKLVSVQALHRRYTAELGDVVVGRVIEIVAKRWKLDLHSHQEASLMLSAVNLPGGVQRRRTVEDELNMRAVFQEGDLISAEIQQLFNDGSVALHTRSAKYGKLETGQLVIVPAALVPRQKKHLCSLPEVGADLILGVNGMIWVTVEGSLEATKRSEKPTKAQLESIARVANAIRVLARLDIRITATRVVSVVQASLQSQTRCLQMLDEKFLLSVVAMEARLRQEADD